MVRSSMENETYELKDGFLVRKSSSEVCVKRFAKVSSVSTAVQDLDDYAAVRYIKAYVNAFNLGFPVEFYTIIRPIDRIKFVKDLEKTIVENSIIYEVNPLKADSKIKAEKARLIRSRVMRDSIQPFETEVYIAVSSCGEDLDTALEGLNVKMRVLHSTVNSLGIEVEYADAEKVISRSFLNNLTNKRSLASKLFDALRRRLLIADVVSLPIFTFIPLLGRAKPSLRSTGIKLGVDIESREEIYWDLNKTTSPHILVIGPSGIGKTTFLSKLSISLGRTGISVLVLDPKNEYKNIFESLGVEVAYFSLGKNLSIGISELLGSLRNMMGNEAAEVLIDILSLHPELSRKDVFPCLYTMLNRMPEIGVDSNDLEVLNTLKRLARYCSDDYSEYSVGKVLTALSLISKEGSGLISLLRAGKKISVVDFSSVLTVDPLMMPMIMKVISSAIKIVSPSPSWETPKYIRAIVIDEAWSVLRDESLRVVEELIRTGRSFGTIVAMATQTVKDLTKTLGPLVDSLGLLVILPSTSSDYWDEISKLIKVSKERIERMRSLGRGYALVRIAPDPRTLLVKLGP